MTRHNIYLSNVWQQGRCDPERHHYEGRYPMEKKKLQLDSQFYGRSDLLVTIKVPVGLSTRLNSFSALQMRELQILGILDHQGLLWFMEFSSETCQAHIQYSAVQYVYCIQICMELHRKEGMGLSLIIVGLAGLDDCLPTQKQTYLVQAS